MLQTSLDIGHLLRSLKLEQYEQAFARHDVDSDLLPSLTAEDLEEIGIASDGHRRRLLDTIARPRGTECRRMTVMFCDLVGSTRLATRLDPEDLAELLGLYRACIARVVEQHGGSIGQHLGDGALMYFGFPQALAHEAEAAIAAGLALVEAVGKLPTEERLEVRVGIATGPVIMGAPHGRQAWGAIGGASNVAMELAALAAPNTVVISEATRQQIGPAFDLTGVTRQASAGFGTVYRAA